MTATERQSEPGLVSVVVVNHDRCALLAACLRSILDQSYAPIEVIVVDNASRDGSRRMVEALEDVRVRLVSLPENRGFSGGCNAGIAAARGELIALLNNDAEADPDWLKCMVRELAAQPGCGMVASRIRHFNAGIIDKAGHRIFLDGQNRGFGTGQRDGARFHGSAETLFPDGCAAIYRRSVLEAAGGFDEDFFAYADDADLGLRVRWLGWDARYCGSAVVEHHHSSTAGRYSPQKIYLVERNRIWLLIKDFPLVLILVSPLTTAYRLAWNGWAWLWGRGAAGNFRRRGGGWILMRTLVRAWRDALTRLPAMWRKRKQVRRQRQLSDWEFLQLLWRFRIRARELACEDLIWDSHGLDSPAPKDQVGR